MFEHHREPLLPVRQFAWRVVKHCIMATTVTIGALAVGMEGYHAFAGIGWIDSFLNASMILGGMGPVNELNSNGAKLFAGCYALFAGLAFIGVVGIILIPIVHRFLHALHIDDDD